MYILQCNSTSKSHNSFLMCQRFDQTNLEDLFRLWAQNPFQRPLTPEQADFRGLLRTGSVRPSYPPPGQPQTSNKANQLDFRGLLKKAPTSRQQDPGGTTESGVLGVPSSLGSSENLPQDSSEDVFSTSPYVTYEHVDDSQSGTLDSKGGTVESRGGTNESLSAASKSPFESPASKGVSGNTELLSSTSKGPSGISAGKKFSLSSSKSEVCHLYSLSR